MSTARDTGFAVYVELLSGLLAYREDGAPQGSRTPYLTYVRLDLAPQYHTKGVSDIESVLYRLTLHSWQPDQIGAVEDALSNGLHNYRGPMGDAVSRGTFIETIQSGLTLSSTGGQPQVHTREFDVRVWFERTPITR